MDHSAPTRSATIQAFLLYTFAVFSYAVVDAATKLLRLDYGFGTWQILLLTRLPPLLVALALTAQATGSPFRLKTAFPKWHLLRGVLVAITSFAFFDGLKYLPLADCIVLAFAAPVFVTALSGPLLGERVGWRRWSAVGVGFIGVIVAVKPGAPIGYGTWLILISAAAYALTLLTLRRISGKEGTHNILFYSTAFTLVISFVPGIREWQPVGWHAAGIMLLQGLASACGQLSMTRALRLGEASMLVPIEFTALVWAVLFGYMFWNDIPVIEVLAGAALIIAANIYISHREARLAKSRGIAPSPRVVPEHPGLPD
ncbi:MAG TPA: DMT family transporter [Dongiaceae bacterium]|jgi:drug/metabolite transporter (DMT)-like permease